MRDAIKEKGDNLENSNRKKKKNSSNFIDYQFCAAAAYDKFKQP